MIRRSLFFGLTLILLLGFVFLSVRGCKQEEEPADQPMETVEKSEATSTRVLKPQDLEVALSKTVLEKYAGPSDKPSFAARHEIEILNRGNVPYKSMLLNIDYLAPTGKVLETRRHSIVETVLPRAALKLEDIRIDGLTGRAAEARISIIYADIGSSSPEATTRN